jgi:hypothetical protein
MSMQPCGVSGRVISSAVARSMPSTAQAGRQAHGEIPFRWDAS